VTGDAAGKTQAVQASSILAMNDDNEITIARAGAVEPLVQLLRTGDAAGKTRAAQALSNLACNADNQIVIARAGALEPLVQLPLLLVSIKQ